MEKALWSILVALFVMMVALVIVAAVSDVFLTSMLSSKTCDVCNVMLLPYWCKLQAKAPVEAILTVAGLCGFLSVAFSYLVGNIASHKVNNLLNPSETGVSMTMNNYVIFAEKIQSR